MGVITPNSQERTSVSQYRFFMAFAGQWLIRHQNLYFPSTNRRRPIGL